MPGSTEWWRGGGPPAQSTLPHPRTALQCRNLKQTSGYSRENAQWPNLRSVDLLCTATVVSDIARPGLAWPGWAAVTRQPVRSLSPARHLYHHSHTHTHQQTAQIWHYYSRLAGVL